MSRTRAKAGEGAGRVKDSYLDLVIRHPLVSIKTDSQLAAAQRVVDDLLQKDRLDKGEEEYLDVLSDLIAIYEDRHHPIPPASDADILRHLIEARGVTQSEVAVEAGVARSTICEILSGKRSISKSHIGKLAAYFRVPPEVFVANL